MSRPDFSSSESGGGSAFGGIADGAYAFWGMREGGGQSVVDTFFRLPGAASALSWGRGGATFNGSSSYIGLPSHTSVSCSVTCRVMINNVGTTQRLYCNGASFGNGFGVQVFSSGIRGIVGFGGGGQVVGSSATIASGVWFTHTLTFDGTRMRQWINGIMRTDDAAATSTPTAAAASRIGSRPDNNEWFGGTMMLCILHRRSLKPVEIQVLHQLIALEEWMWPNAMSLGTVPSGLLLFSSMLNCKQIASCIVN